MVFTTFPMEYGVTPRAEMNWSYWTELEYTPYLRNLIYVSPPRA